VIGSDVVRLCCNLPAVAFAPNSRLRAVAGFQECPFLAIRLPESVELVTETAFKNVFGLCQIEFLQESRLRAMEMKSKRPIIMMCPNGRLHVRMAGTNLSYCAYLHR
jgi:hypothetical protein